MKRNNALIIVSSLLLYIGNQHIKEWMLWPRWIKLVLTCYFNDILAGVLIISYTNFILSFYNGGSKEIRSIKYIELLVLVCGLFWEYISPIFRTDQVTDPIDILAYLAGGIIYYVIRTKLDNREIW